jgi:O-antigen/teichoic acid export membrane protein
LIRQVAGALDPITRGWAVIFTGSMARLALGLVASILIARALGPAAFGVFAVLAAASGIAGAIADAGLSGAAVRRIASAWPEDPAEARSRARCFLWLRLGAGGAVLAAGALVSRPLAELMGLQDGQGLLVLALLGVLATAMSGAVATLLQALGRFGQLSLVMLANSALTVMLAAILAGWGQLNIVTALLVLGVGTSLAGFAVGLRLLPSGWTLDPPPLPVLKAEGGQQLRFGMWLWAGGLFAMLAAQLDVLLVSRWLDPAVVGVYALALNLARKVEVVNHSLHTVLLPAAAALRSESAEREYLRAGAIRGAVLSAALLPLFPLAEPMIVLLYGPSFAPAAYPFQLLLGVAIFDLLASPFLLLIYPRNRPRLQAGADALRAAVLGVAAMGLIPLFGPAGAVAARLLSRVAGAIFTLALLARGRRGEPVLPEGDPQRQSP